MSYLEEEILMMRGKLEEQRLLVQRSAGNPIVNEAAVTELERLQARLRELEEKLAGTGRA